MVVHSMTGEMTGEEILDEILIPRPNGSDAMEQVGDFLFEVLNQAGALTTRHEFSGTPHGFQIVWTITLLLMLGYCFAIGTRRYALALLPVLIVPMFLLAEFEFLYSPLSGLAPLVQSNIVGLFEGDPGGPTLLFCAHYDTATHFGDHFSWGRWGSWQGPATGLAIALPILGFWMKKRGHPLAAAIALPLAALSVIPFAAMFWFQTVGPMVREPSPGAIDNGGSLAALVLLAQDLADRSPDAPTNVEIVFLAAEEERALGSWAFAKTLSGRGPVAVINLESVGASNDLAYIAEDGFALTRYRSSDQLIDLVNAAAEDQMGAPLQARELPFGTLTDGRSFLAHDIPALTLRAFDGESFPRNLHSSQDSRDRLEMNGIEEATRLMRALIDRVDRDPTAIEVVNAFRPNGTGRGQEG